MNLFDYPEYYDIAFSGDIEQEILKYRRCFECCEHDVKFLLEPACGSGRFLRAFPNFGYNIIGYDISSKMVKYAQESIKGNGLEDMSTALIGDMASMRFKTEVFDAAFNSVNSLGYLHSDAAISSHLVNTADALRPGGVYVIELILAWKDFPQIGGNEGWVSNRDGVKVRINWDNLMEDHEMNMSFQRVAIEAIDSGRYVTLRELHMYRLWNKPDLYRLIDKTGMFSILRIFDGNLAPIPVKSDLSGELGNLLFVLSKDKRR